MKTYKFYDTCSLLLNVENLQKEEAEIVISSITLSELEGIKTSANKDIETKIAARRLLNFFTKNPEAYTTHIFNTSMLKPITKKSLPVSNDTQILATAIDFNKKHNNMIFVTNDLSLYHIASLFFEKEKLDRVELKAQKDYEGYLEIKMTDDEIADFYSNQNKNMYNLLVNQYLIIYNNSNEIIDTLCWTGHKYRSLNYKTFGSKQFGDVRPFKGDIYQALFADSLINNTITMVKGPAGSGKTYLSLSYLFNLLEHGKIDKIVVFCNTIATKNSAKLGFYPGTRDEKLLDSQIGNLLISKLGGRIVVEQLIQEEKLVLLPLSDIRGYDTSGMHAGIYISEAQNMDTDLMKLTLQRIGEDSICIIDGDCKAQVDNAEFAGSNNGMRRASKVFRGHDVYGEVTLKTIHRSKIAQIAESI